MSEKKPIKVAVVGSGLAGLTAAYLLKRPCSGEQTEFEVHLFEKASTIGMDSSSISVTVPNQKDDWRIDVPMRSFQGGYYKNLFAFYKTLGVEFRQTDYTYSFSSLKFPTDKWHEPSITTTMIYNGASGRAGVSKPTTLGGDLLVKHDTLSYFVHNLWSSALFLFLTAQLLFCYLITLYHALPVGRPTNLPNLTFREWAVQTTPTNFIARLIRMDVAWDYYVQTMLIPLLSGVCTCPEEDVLNHPMEEILDFVWLTLGTHHYIVKGGVRNVVACLTEGIDHIHLGTSIVAVQADNHDSRVITISCLANGQVKDHTGFHHIILATQASGAVSILDQYIQSLPTNLGHRKEGVERLIGCLKAFEYRSSLVINHTDDSLLPENEKDRRDLNFISIDPKASILPEKLSDLSVSSSYAMATHILRRPEEISKQESSFFQTTNPIIPPKRESLLSVVTLERAIVTSKSKYALKSLITVGSKKWWQSSYECKTYLGELQGAYSSMELTAPGIWVCGSYAHLGIPLLEGCVISARNVVEQGILQKENARWTSEPWVI